MKTDEICEKYEKDRVNLTLKLIDDEEESTTVLVEGRSSALRMLAELLIAVADKAESESFFISSFGPGRIHFSSAAKLGVYIHRIED